MIVKHLNDISGYTLIEIIMVILIVGILMAVATMEFAPRTETARFEATVAEMQALTYAIAGNPELNHDGARTDFGYVGDVGAMPPNLDALVINPGLGTWDGPYMDCDFDNDGYKKDAWGSYYIYADTLLQSTGSGSNIDKLIASSTTALTSNTVKGVVHDAKMQPPGISHSPDIFARLIYPNGSGGLANDSAGLAADGYFQFSNIPIGNHTLKIIYAPDSDTITQFICITPGRDLKLDISFPADLW